MMMLFLVPQSLLITAIIFHVYRYRLFLHMRGGRVVRWCWVNFQCQSVLLIWIGVGQAPTALAVGAGGCCLDIFLSSILSLFLAPSLWETVRYRLKYCLKGR